jgi:hypothetical protein
VAQIALDGPRIDAIIGQLIATGMAQHVRMDFHIEARGLSRAFDHCLKAPIGERHPRLGDEDEWRPRLLLALQLSERAALSRSTCSQRRSINSDARRPCRKASRIMVESRRPCRFFLAASISLSATVYFIHSCQPSFRLLLTESKAERGAGRSISSADNRHSVFAARKGLFREGL